MKKCLLLVAAVCFCFLAGYQVSADQEFTDEQILDEFVSDVMETGGETAEDSAVKTSEDLTENSAGDNGEYRPENSAGGNDEEWLGEEPGGDSEELQEESAGETDADWPGEGAAYVQTDFEELSEDDLILDFGEEYEEIIDPAMASVKYKAVITSPLKPGIGIVTEQERTVLTWFRDHKTIKGSIQYQALDLLMSGQYLHKVYGRPGYMYRSTWVMRNGTANTENNGFTEPSFDCSGFVGTLYYNAASDNKEFRSLFNTNVSSDLRSCSTMYETKWATRSEDFFCMDEVKQSLSTGDLILIRGNGSSKLASHVLLYLGVLPNDVARAVGIEPGKCLVVDCHNIARPVLGADSNYKNMGGVSFRFDGKKTVYENWGVQIREYDSDRCVAFIDMDQFTDIRDFTASKVYDFSDKTYTGKEISWAPSVVYKSEELTPGVDYEIKYTGDRIHPGTVKVTFTGLGAYSGSFTKTVRINPRSISKASVSGIKDKTWTGSRLKQNMTVAVNNTVLKQGVDYTVAYSANLKPGTAAMTITGTGNYKGTVKKTFKINKCKIQSASIKYSTLKYTGKAKTQTSMTSVYAIVGGNKVALKNGTDYMITYKNNVNPGKATMTITAKGNYTGTIRKTFSIVK